METVNTILIIIGAIVTLIGVAGFFNPSFTRFINFPGGPKLKATVAIIIGIIIAVSGVIFKFPAN